jgi:hypothetical protein
MRIREEDVPVIRAEHVIDPGKHSVLLVIRPSEAPSGKSDILQVEVVSCSSEFSNKPTINVGVVLV